MMDPVSFAASAAGLASFALQVAQAVTTYIKAAKDAPQTVNEIEQELFLTQGVLERLERFLASKTLSATTFDPSSILPAAIASCHDVVFDVSDKLQKAQQNGKLRVRERLKWPFTEKETQKRVSALRRCASTFQFSLTIEGCNMLSQTSKDATEALELQLQTYEKVLELTADVGTMSLLASEALKFSEQVENILHLINALSDNRGVLRSIAEQVDTVITNSRETKEQQILDWLSSNDYTRKHRDISARRFRGTGQWLLDCNIFQTWLDAASPVLLCTGSPGVGKSVLTSLVIDHIHEHPPSNAQGLAYFYFDFVDQQIQTPTNLVGSLLRQLASQAVPFPQPLVHFHQRFREDEAHGSTSELLLVLKGVCKRFQRCFIIVDALDECQKSYRGEILRILTDLRMTPVQIFVTSRPHPHDIKSHFRDIAHIKVAASEADIRTYCLRKIDGNDDTRELMDDKLRVEITNKISKNASGMFLLPVLQMQFILDAMTRAEIRKSIGNLSANLGEAFTDTIRRIDNEPENRRRAAKEALMWILHSCRPLQINELRYALAIEIGTQEFDYDNMLQAKLIVDCCLGLVVIDDGSSVVRLVHHTLQDYLQSELESSFQQEESEITKACLTYLCLDDIPTSTSDQRGFLDYAATHWGHHAEHALPEEIEELAISFLTDDTKLARAEEYLLQRPPSRSELAWHRQTRNRMSSHEGVSGLHVAAAFGLTEISRRLLDAGINTNAQDSRDNTPLHEATSNGQIEAATTLLGHGAHPDLRNSDRNTALFLAVSYSFEEIVLLLLQHKADPNLRCADGWTALHQAADKGHLEIVQLLLEHGASIHEQSARGLIGLHRAAGRGYLEIVKLLLDQGSPVDTITKDSWTPLHGAASSGQFEAVTLLLDNGAFIDHQSSEGRTSLHRACRGGHYLTVAALLSKGANHLLPDTGNNLPLHRAAKGGHAEIAKLLLDHNPSTRMHQMTFQHHHGRTPRAEAKYCGHMNMVVMLRKEESHLLHHRSTSDTRHALEIAIEDADLDQISSLLSLGVKQNDDNDNNDNQKNININKLNAEGLAPLHQAYLMANEPIIALLLHHSASFRTRTSDGWEPLHCAAKTGIESAVRQCLDHGADVRAATNDGQTALHKVCKSGDLPTTRLLIERGADLEAEDAWGWRPAHTAAAAGSREIVELLIEAGAEVEARDREGRSPQACASGAGHRALAEFLRVERHRAEAGLVVVGGGEWQWRVKAARDWGWGTGGKNDRYRR